LAVNWYEMNDPIFDILRLWNRLRMRVLARIRVKNKNLNVTRDFIGQKPIVSAVSRIRTVL